MQALRARRWLVRVATAAAVVVVAWLSLSLLAWLAVPPWVKWQIESRLTAASGRSVQVGTVAFNPWRLDLVIADLRIAEANDRSATPGAGAPALLTVARVELDLAASSFVHAAPVVEAVTIDALRLRITRLAPGHYDVDDVLDRLASASGSKPAPGQPPHFALYNARVRDAAVRFDDRPAGRVHELTGLDLSLPFLSNLPAQIDVQVAPHLAFKLNGVPFDGSGIGTPFAVTRSGALKLAVNSLDIGPYLAYLPESLPVRVAAGVLSTDLALQFTASTKGPPTLDLQGTVAMQNVRILAPDGAALVAWRRADIDVRSAEPLVRRLALGSVRIEGADVRVRRGADGRLDGPGADSTDAPSATRPSAKLGAALAADQTAAAAPDAWQIALDRLQIADSAVTWNDAAVRPAAALRLSGLTLAMERLQWPWHRPVDISAHGSLARQGADSGQDGRVSVRGSVSLTTATLRASIQRLPLGAFEGYFAQALTPAVDGHASAEARVDWSANGAAAGNTRVVLDAATVEALALRPSDRSPGAAVPVTVERVSLTDVQVDVASHGVMVGKVSIDAPSLALSRGRGGVIDASDWFVPPPAAASAPAAPWRVELAEASLNGGRLQWTDASVTATDPVRVAIADLHFGVKRLIWEGGRPAVPAHFEASGRFGLPLAPGEPASRIPGTFDWRGVVGVTPLAVIGRLKVERLPLHLLMPYAGDTGWPVRIARVELGVDGQLSLRRPSAGLDVDAGADVLLGAVRIETLPRQRRSAPGETLLSWNTLGLKGVQIALKPGARPKIDIAEAALTDFYARLAVTEDGRLNIRSLAGDVDVASPPPPPSANARPAPPTDALPVDLRLGATTLAAGRIDFSDHFVRPNYSAALTELSGRLGALDVGRPTVAPLTLRGKAAGTAQLEIDGSVDPFGRPPTLDIRAKATDLELAPLSPYAGKYAGYAIERGKLSVDVAYRLAANGQLDASNRVVLHQLTFGEKIESPTATSLPVRFAVSLLKDRDGVIDLDLPIRGSVNDPQFSVAAIIGRLLGNLLTRAITSPFSLLTHRSDGGEPDGDPARVEFVSGTARLTQAGRAAVDTVAQALAGKPGLLLTVTGTADAAREEAAYRSAVLEDRIEAERRKASVASAAAASAPLPPLSADERLRLLRQIYREADLPDKPRNILGLQSDPPAADMEARLAAAIAVTPDTVRALALQRGVGVRDALIAKGLPSDRLFLAAPQVDPADPSTPTAPEARLALTPR